MNGIAKANCRNLSYFAALKKLQLEVDEDLAFLLFGLVSGHKASKMAHFLNLLKLFDLEWVEDLELPDYKPKASIGFSRFAAHDEENHLDYYLIANKEFGMTLISDLRQFDYLLIIRGGIEFFDSPLFVREGMKLQGIQLIAPIEHEKIRSKISWVL